MTFARYLPLALLLMLSVHVTPAPAADLTLQDANALFSTANAAYRAQDFDKAYKSYQQLLEAGFESPQVLYNAGTTAARLEKTGEAMGYLMRAHKMAPRDENVSANLYKVKLEYATKAGLDEDAAAAISREDLWSRIIGFFTAGEWILMLWAALLAACLGAFLLLVTKRRLLRATGKAMLALGATVLVILAVPGGTQIYRTRVIEKAIAVSSAEVLSGPADRFTRVAQLREGQLVKNLGRHEDGYNRVRLENGLQGYVSSQVLMEL